MALYNFIYLCNSNAGKVTTNTYSQGIRFLSQVAGIIIIIILYYIILYYINYLVFFLIIIILLSKKLI